MAHPKSRQGWQVVATRLQPVVDGEDRIKPRGNIYGTILSDAEGVPNRTRKGNRSTRRVC